ncbi:ERV/ALR sulphydryl oxidase [Penicillium macrosclerotiorum]|uniref:ERV/ALR sulphydryl oxidase n=1 Tax=Penicillium macrosclerotiorum TaxID=303699 RepID=UPI002548251F|nr:ERV/ALR sulphydryl oxidase [Penicillium macrosclerotiorum]KAJ5692492.1 ERV/ALR sulphydryl oxidase [Penicillium macrosclerotiorum]
MAEVQPEQIAGQFRDQAFRFNQMPASSSKEAQEGDPKAPLPKGVVLDKDGKPCRTCTSAASWRALAKQAKSQPSASPSSSSSTSNSSTATIATPALASIATSSPSETASDCPPDVEALGRSTWTLLHSMAATYPEKADTQQQKDMQGFLKLFSKLYPCWVCADDFQTWMAHPSGQNQPKLGGRKEFGWWMCEAHNEVNRKLGKKEFDCRLWEQRWRTGWKDGRCE